MLSSSFFCVLQIRTTHVQLPLVQVLVGERPEEIEARENAGFGQVAAVLSNSVLLRKYVETYLNMLKIVLFMKPVWLLSVRIKICIEVALLRGSFVNRISSRYSQSCCLQLSKIPMVIFHHIMEEEDGA